MGGRTFVLDRGSALLFVVGVGCFRESVLLRDGGNPAGDAADLAVDDAAGEFDGGDAGPGLDGRWRAISVSGAPFARLGFSAAWSGREMLVWGGMGCTRQPCDEPFEETLLDSGGIYDPAEDHWLPTTLEGAPSPRTEAACLWAGDALLIWSGLEGQESKGGPYLPPLDDGAWYSPEVGSWAVLGTDGAPQPRAGANEVWTGREVIVWGGGVPDDPLGGFRALHDGGRLDPASAEWRGMAPLDAVDEDETTSPFVVWTGSAMTAWYGRRADPPRPGWRYDPDADAWTPMAPHLGEDRACGVVWTGSDFLAFGHESFSRYDPVADEWTISPSGVTLCATPVWTGREVLLWRPSGSPPGPNARFDVETQVVAPIESDGAPSARSGFAVFWTGNEMLIWGGQDEATHEATNTGALYRPPAR